MADFSKKKGQSAKHKNVDGTTVLNPAQERVLRSAIDFLEERSRPPSVGDLGKRLGLSRTGVQHQLNRLEELGYISRTGETFGLRILKDETGRTYEWPGALPPAVPPPPRLEPRQRAALDALSRAFYGAGGPVTAATVSRAMNTDTRVAQRRLQPLVDLGFVALENQRYRPVLRSDGSPALGIDTAASRQLPATRSTSVLQEARRRLLETMDLLDAASTAQSVPIVWEPFEIAGEIAAGYDDMANQPFEREVVFLPSGLLPQNREGLFMLRIRGESMMPAIKSGDVAILRRTPKLDNGQVGAVLLPDDTATLKRVYVSPASVELRPENPEFEPIVLSEEITVLGRLVGIWRDYE